MALPIVTMITPRKAWKNIMKMHKQICPNPFINNRKMSKSKIGAKIGRSQF